MVKFSVVIPCYNSAWCIKRCIDSVLDQIYKDFEIVVVDNYSEDGTLDILKEYQDNRIRTYQIHNNGVIALSRNKGIKEASGEWICFLDSDDCWTKDKLSLCNELTDSYDLIYHQMKTFSEVGVGIRLQGRKVDEPAFVDILTNGNMICNSSVCVRREVLADIGYLMDDPALSGVEDCDCWIRVSQKGYRFGYINKVLGYYWLGNNFSISPKQLEREHLLLERHISELSEDEKQLANNTLSFKKGRILHKIGDFKGSMYYYRKALCFSAIPRVFKISILYIALFFRIRM